MSNVSNRIVKVNDVLNIDSEHGLVFGYAIVCKVRADHESDFEDYYDLNIDHEGVHKGQRVPENITEDAMFKGAVDAAATGFQVAGNELHQGPNVGSYYFMLPLTEAMATALNWKVTKTGLVVGYHPGDADVLAKFKNGTYTGFSIEGARIEYEETEEAA